MEQRVLSGRQSGTRDILLPALVLLLIAGVSRVIGLGEWAFVGDEYFTAYHAAERARDLTSNPLYYALVEATYRVFGFSEFAARFPAFLLGTLSIPVFFLLGSRVCGRNAALTASIFILLSGWHLWHSQAARFYSGVFLFATLGWFLYLRALTRGSVPLMIAALAAQAVAALFHQTAVLVAVACTVHALFTRIFASGDDPGIRKVTTAWLVTACVALIAVSPELYTRTLRWLNKGESWGAGPVVLTFQLARYFNPVLLVTALVGLVRIVRENPFVGGFLVTGVGVPALLMLALSAFMPVRPDYLFHVTPLLFLTAGYLCSECILRDSGRSRLAAYAMTLVVATAMLPEFVSHYTGRKGLDVRQPVAFVERAYAPGDRVLSLVNGFDRYVKREPSTYRLLPWPGTPYDESVDWDRLLSNAVPQSGRLWILLPLRRKPLAPSLENWLLCHARLAWRRASGRFDYTYEGYQVFVAGPALVDARLCRALAETG